MSTIRDVALRFLEACESGEGWEGCRDHCHSEATFSCHADILAEIGTVEEYTEWMKGLYTILPDFEYDLKAFATDEEGGSAIAYAVGRGTHTGEGGPVPPTGKRAAVDYVYVMEFDGDRIRHMTKVWNDAATAKQLGWM